MPLPRVSGGGREEEVTVIADAETAVPMPPSWERQAMLSTAILSPLQPEALAPAPCLIHPYLSLGVSGDMSQPQRSLTFTLRPSPVSLVCSHGPDLIRGDSDPGSYRTGCSAQWGQSPGSVIS